MNLYIYIKAEIFFVTRSFLFHTYHTRVFMTKLFLLLKYRKVLQQCFFSLPLHCIENINQ